MYDRMMGRAHLLLAAAVLGASGCSLHVFAGADRTTVAGDAGYGWHLGFGAGFAFDPRQKGSVAVAASRRADSPGVGYDSYRTDGWEARGALDLPQPGWRGAIAARLATGEQAYRAGENSAEGGGRAWGLAVGLSRYWPRLAHAMEVTAGPAISSWDGGLGTVRAIGFEARFTWTFDGMLKVFAACGEQCLAEIAAYKPKGSSSGSHSFFGGGRGTACYYATRQDARGNPKQVWVCP